MSFGTFSPKLRFACYSPYPSCAGLCFCISAVHQVLHVIKGCILSGNCPTPCNVEIMAEDKGKLVKVSRKYSAAS